jgi:hypothetical protein
MSVEDELAGREPPLVSLVREDCGRDLTKADIAGRIYFEIGLRANQTEEMVRQLLGYMMEACSEMEGSASEELRRRVAPPI